MIEICALPFFLIPVHDQTGQTGVLWDNINILAYTWWQDVCFLVLYCFNWAMLIDGTEKAGEIIENSDFLEKVTEKVVMWKSMKRVVQNTQSTIV